MNETPRQKLCEVVRHYGISVCDDARRCEAILRDLCPQYIREIHVLSGALKQRVAYDLLNSSQSLPLEVRLAQLSKRLVNNLALNEEASEWAVYSWALALDLISDEEIQRNSSQINYLKKDETNERKEFYQYVDPWSEPLRAYSAKFFEFFKSGNEFFNKGDYDRAITEYTKSIELNPIYAQAYTNRGNAYSNQGNYDHAIADYTKAIKLDPCYVYGYMDRGNAYFNKGNYDHAIADYNEAIQIHPNYIFAYINRGLSYFQKGNHNKALDNYNEAIEINPNHADAYNNRGLVYFNQGNYQQAIADYNKAIQLNPNHTHAHKNREIAYEKGM